MVCMQSPYGNYFSPKVITSAFHTESENTLHKQGTYQQGAAELFSGDTFVSLWFHSCKKRVKYEV